MRQKLPREITVLLGLIFAVALLVFLKSALAAQESTSLPEATAPAVSQQTDLGQAVAETASPEGKEMPSFQIMSENGPLSNSDLTGEPFVLEFIATTCPYCQASAPAFRSVFSDSDVTYIVLSALDEPMSLMKRWKRERMSQGIVATDPGNLVTELGLRGTPTTLFVDREGKIKTLYPGEIGTAEINAFLKEIE